MHHRLPALILGLIAILAPSALFAQGSLTPPSGTPAPTMKTLDQIESRTPIGSVPFTISTPGSYYLTGNLNVTTGDAITIATSNVTLDLNGFTLSSTSASPTGSGITWNGQERDITIVNGHIKGQVTYSGSSFSGSGFANGIYAFGSSTYNVRVSGVSVSGVYNHGIALDVTITTVVESCTVTVAGGNGITAAIVRNSAALNCGGNAIRSGVVSECHGAAVNSGYGIYGSTIQHSIGYSTSGTGLSATGMAIGCYGQSDTGTGLEAYIANSCRGASGSGAALAVTNKYNMP